MCANKIKWKWIGIWPYGQNVCGPTSLSVIGSTPCVSLFARTFSSELAPMIFQPRDQGPEYDPGREVDFL